MKNKEKINSTAKELQHRIDALEHDLKSEVSDSWFKSKNEEVKSKYNELLANIEEQKRKTDQFVGETKDDMKDSWEDMQIDMQKEYDKAKVEVQAFMSKHF
ncbi:hypothetical protein KC717_01710 [Candidatus Dojkabacteria bacterium]|uniref:Uncharacterized protein n=1 Tax=Candidatus Dojkabacteria bacterium TaxID=2099670 RepID=A0A955RJZ5_9BACT|nr:hypothetical protein [Candidatus Dojkabacteria bacterium]